jgi:glycosyltransferase involved in cell wall biosynthesis
MLMLNSYHEALPLVLIEAMILGVPVFTTNTISAKEIVGDRGFVCENSEKGIYKELRALLSDTQRILDIKTGILKYEYPNNLLREKFLEIAK